MVVHVKFMALREENGEVGVASGVVMNCPSVQALRDRLDEMGAAIVYAEEATAEEVAEAQANKEE